MTNPKPGAAITLALAQGTLTEELVEAIFCAVLEPNRMNLGQLEGWNRPLTRRHRKKVVAEKGLAAMDIYWEPPPRDGPVHMGMMLTYHFDAQDLDGLKIGDAEVLTVWIWDSQLLGENSGRFGVPRSVFRRIVDIAQPVFAIVDDYSNIKKRKSEDLRQFAWGATVYGHEMVDAIGLDRLRSAPAWRVEELPWDGVWVQAGENPFTVDFRAKQAVEKHLGLRGLFGAAQEVKTKPKRTK